MNCDEGLYTYNGQREQTIFCAALNFDNGDCVINNDGDGFDDAVDCDDSDPTIFLRAPELPNDGTDQDCDGCDSIASIDSDGDGFDETVDCNVDLMQQKFIQKAPEAPNDGIDQDRTIRRLFH